MTGDADVDVEAEPDTPVYREAKRLAASPDPSVRRAVAVRSDTPPEILYFLAEDVEASVRFTVAGNESTPLRAHLLLADDPDETVRTELARKAPDVAGLDKERLLRLSSDVLEILARDQMPKVRRILAEALKDVTHAPPAVIRRLSLDAEISVAAPVLEFSPVLTEADLLQVIAAAPPSGSLSAISRRRAVPERVSDAIAGSGDKDAIAVLLGNRSAQIREETLDDLIARAPRFQQWHEPLTQRQKLPRGAVRRLALFVADNLLQSLRERSDLDAETAAEVARVVYRRIEEREAPPPGDAAAWTEVRAIHAGGRLDERVMVHALTAGGTEFVVEGLALRSGVATEAIRRILSSQSAKGVMALAWRAGLSPEFGTMLQTRMARIPPSQVIAPTDPKRFPLRKDEMELHLASYFGVEREEKG